MTIKAHRKIKNWYSLLEAALFGFIFTVFAWIVLSLIYDAFRAYDRYINSKTDSSINIDIFGKSIDLKSFGLELIILCLLAKLSVDYFNKEKENTSSSWIITAVVTFIYLYLFIFIKESYLTIIVYNNWMCYAPDSIDYVLWISIFILIIVFAFFYTKVRNYLVPQKSLSN